MPHVYGPNSPPLLGPDGTPRVEGVVDDDGVYHYIQGQRVKGGYSAAIDAYGWFTSLCNKPHPGPLVLMKATTCLACIVVCSEP